MASTVTFRDNTPPERVSDLFYQTRKKLDDLRPSLPQGVLGPQVNDEYGDVYSVVYMLTADGLDLGRLKDVAEDMRQRLLRVPDGSPMILLFVYPRPEPEAWASLMESYASRIHPISVKETSAIGDYPESLYICKLAVEGAF